MARLIGDRLRAAGVRYVFGHPGGEVVDLIEGFREAGLEFVLTRHETSAGFMADAIATANGVPGVCVGTLGPGATNLVTGVAQSFLDRSPVIAFSGQLPVDRYEITTHQRLDLKALFGPITKWQARVTPANARDLIDRAVRESLRPRRGPVYLEVPSDVPRQESRDPMAQAEEFFKRGDAFAPVPMPGIDPMAAGMAAGRIRGSRKPLILAGMDANDDVSASRLKAFAEEWSIPVMDSPKSKGVFPEDHPLFLGTIEMLGTARLFDYANGRDLVLMIGFDPVEFDRDWRAAADIVHIGPLPNDDRYYRASVEVVGPVNEAIDAIRSLCGTGEAKSKPEDVAAFREEFRAYVAPKRKGLTSQRVLATLRDGFPDDTIATCDVGYNKAVTGQCWTARAPKTFFMSNGLSSMGYGLPAAIALKLLHRDRDVVCVLGDGGFAMTMAELETAVRLELPVLVVVLADEALSQIKAAQERKGFPVVGTTFRDLDYVAIARGFGATGHDVSDEAGLREAIAEMRSSKAKTPTLIATHVDASAYKLD